jgi:hypothetical protein
MATTSNTYTGNGSNKLFSITFPYLETTDVDVYLNGTLQTITTQYTFANATTIEFVAAPANGAVVLLDRSTDDATLQATFFPGSSIKAADLNLDFDQVLYIAQETSNEATTATSTAATATTTANTALSQSAAAVSTANTASSNASAAVSTANTASTNASNAVTTANTASSNATTAVNTANAATSTANSAASDASTALSTANTALTNANSAVTTANTASSNATAAVSTANTASTNASNAVTTANGAVTTANTADTNSNTAITTANAAVSTANSANTTAGTANTNAANAVTTANTASTNASAAVTTANSANTTSTAANSTAATALSTANTALSTANTALSTANTASTNASSAVTTANSADSKADQAIAAVASSINYTLVANVAGIPSSPTNGLYIEVGNSTGLESFTPLAGLPSGFVGDSGLTVRLVYQTSNTSWNWLTYFANNSETRYLKLAGGTLTGALAHPLGAAATPSITFTGDTNTGIYSPSADQVAISTSGQGRLYIAADGKVGIGVASPQGLLHLGGTGPVLTVTKNVSGTDNILYYDNSTANNDLYIGRDSSNLIFRQANNERMRIDSSGRLGVGSSSPEETVDVNGAITWRGSLNTGKTSAGALDRSGNELRIRAYGATAGTGQLVFRTGGGGGSVDSEAMRIDSSGRLGIGTSAPQARLDLGLGVSTYTAGTETLLFPSSVWGPSIGSNNRTYLHFTGAGGGSTFAIGIHGYQVDNPAATNYFKVAPGIAGNPVTYYRFDSDGFKYFADSSKTAGDPDYTPTQRFTIDTSGRVGIGTSSPFALLHVKADTNKNLVVQNGGADTIELSNYNAGDGYREVAFGGSVLRFNTGTAGSGSSSERMRITSAGRVGIGSTSPGMKLTINDTTTAQIQLGYNDSIYGRIGRNSSGNYEFSSYENGGNLLFGTTGTTGSTTERARIDSSGRLGIGTTSANTSIDVRTISTTAYSASNLSAYTGAYISNDGTGGFANITLNAADATGNSNCITAISAISESSGTRNSALAFATRTHSTGNIVERARIDSSGRLLIGTSSAIAGKQSQQRTVQIAKAQASTDQGLGIYHFDGGGQPPNLEIGLSKNNTLGSHTTVSSGDNCGSIKWSGSDGTGFVELASINGVCDGTPGTNDMPGRLVFSTTADGASSPTERFRISSTGAQSSVIPGGSTLYPQFGCRAWVNFNGTGTVAIRASGNVSSITDNGSGLYTMNFTTAMPDANYMVTGSTVGNSQNEGQIVTGSNNLSSQSASSVQFAVMYCANASRNDVSQVNVAIFR